MGNGQGPLTSLMNQSPGMSSAPQGQSPNGQPNPEQIKQMLALLAKQMAMQQQGGQNVPLPKPPAPQGGKAEVGGVAGGIMSIISSVKHRKDATTAQMAESYYNQLQTFLTPTGDPNTDAQNRQKAEMFLSDDKIRKTLEKGLGYFQLMEPEPAPPEAVGVHQAMNKGKQQKPQMRPALPQGGPNIQQNLANLKSLTDIQGNISGKSESDARTKQIIQQTNTGKQEAEANIKNLNVSTAQANWKLENDKSLSDLEKQQLQNNVNLQKSQIDEANKRAKLYDAQAYYYRGGKMTSPQFVQSNYKTAVSSFDKAISDHEQTLKSAQSERDKFQNWQIQYNKSGTIEPTILKSLGFNTMKDFTDGLNQAQANLDSEKQKHRKMINGRQNLVQQQTGIINGQVPLQSATIKAYQMAGISIPSDVVNGMTADVPPVVSDIDNEIMQLIGQ